MTLSIALVAVLVIAVAAGLFARNRASGLRSGGARLNSLPNYHALLCRHLGGLAGAAVPGGLDAGPDRPGRPDGAGLAGRASSCPAFDHGRATRSWPKREEIAAGEREAGLQSGIDRRWRPIYAEASANYAAIGGGIAILIALAGRLLRDAPHRRRFPRAHRGRAMGDGPAARRIADRHPDDARHRPVAAVRKPALLQAGQPDRIPVRHDLEPANGDCAPTRPDRRARSARSRCSGARPSSARSSP